MKRVFVPLWHPPEGGAAGGFVRAKRLLEAMRGYRFAIADTDTGDIAFPHARIKASHLYSCVFFSAARALNWTWVALNLTRAGLRERDLDAVYVPTADIPAVTIPALIVGKARNVPIVAVTFDGPGTVLWSLNRLVHRGFDTIVTLSESSKRTLESDGLRVPIVLGGIGVDFPPADLGAAQKVWDAVFIGRIVAAKGIFDAVEIWETVVRARPNARLAIAGSAAPAFRAQLERFIASRGLSGNVAFLGRIDDAAKWRLYKEARVCLFPSHAEGWGLVPLEAHACGVPVVAYDLPAYRENIARSPGATLVRVLDVDAAAAAVLHYLDDNASVDEGALEAFASQFTWDAAARREEEMLASALRRRERPPESSSR